ncbi:hypothetical protein HPP92_013410 [Vanilla planifolia]|uniref:Uncharacterized protein n=1 Tax=Vanilla planifolia TaxID=51239 RepID=A0A835V0L1_VANPL|nr:hypothetical protein HPP92_013410 [Vanilla planifolia]
MFSNQDALEASGLVKRYYEDIGRWKGNEIAQLIGKRMEDVGAESCCVVGKDIVWLAADSRHGKGLDVVGTFKYLQNSALLKHLSEMLSPLTKLAQKLKSWMEGTATLASSMYYQHQTVCLSRHLYDSICFFLVVPLLPIVYAAALLPLTGAQLLYHRGCGKGLATPGFSSVQQFIFTFYYFHLLPAYGFTNSYAKFTIEGFLRSVTIGYFHWPIPHVHYSSQLQVGAMLLISVVMYGGPLKKPIQLSLFKRTSFNLQNMLAVLAFPPATIRNI